jgi:hypothetical protein
MLSRKLIRPVRHDGFVILTARVELRYEGNTKSKERIFFLYLEDLLFP